MAGYIVRYGDSLLYQGGDDERPIHDANLGMMTESVSLSTLLSQAVSSGIANSGLISANTANDRFGHSLYLNGKSLSHGKSLSPISCDGNILSTVTLP